MARRKKGKAHIRGMAAHPYGASGPGAADPKFGRKNAGLFGRGKKRRKIGRM